MLNSRGMKQRCKKNGGLTSSNQYPTIGICNACNVHTLWRCITGSNPNIWVLAWPQKSTAPHPHEDMPENILNDFNEARSILLKSPRGAAALLRVCIEKILIYLGGERKNSIDKNIALLSKNGLPETIQKAFDVVRITGSNAVYPGTMNLKDDVETANKLFILVNYIVKNQITDPNMIDTVFNDLPEGKKDHINKRQVNNQPK